MIALVYLYVLSNRLTPLPFQVWTKLGLTRVSVSLMQFCPIRPNLPFALTTVTQYSFTVELQDHVSTGRWLVSSTPMQAYPWKSRNSMPPTHPLCFFLERTGPASQKPHSPPPPRRVLQLLQRRGARQRQVQHQVQTLNQMKATATAFRPVRLLVLPLVSRFHFNSNILRPINPFPRRSSSRNCRSSASVLLRSQISS